MALKPLHDRVLVRRVESDEKTAGGLLSLIVQKKNRLKALLLLPVRAPARTMAN